MMVKGRKKEFSCESCTYSTTSCPLNKTGYLPRGPATRALRKDEGQDVEIFGFDRGVGLQASLSNSQGALMDRDIVLYWDKGSESWHDIYSFLWVLRGAFALVHRGLGRGCEVINSFVGKGDDFTIR
eukprot:1361807-Amorphochlora_amoeboformis.AAC.1